MRSLSCGCGRAQAAPPCPSSPCAGRAGAGICTLLAGQSRPLCSRQLHKPSALGFSCQLSSGVSVRETFPALCILPPPFPPFSPQALPPGLVLPNTEILPGAVPGPPVGTDPSCCRPQFLTPAHTSIPSPGSGRRLVSAGKAQLEQRGNRRAHPWLKNNPPRLFIAS